MKRIAIIGTNGLPGRYGGWDQLVNNLTIHLNQDFEFLVYTSSKNKVHKPEVINNSRIIYINLNANGFQSIFYDLFSMLHALNKADILFVCGISGCIFFPFISYFNPKIILNPDGIEWKRKKFNFLTKLFLKISEHLGVKYSNVVISDNKKISEYLNKQYHLETPLIEYGGDHVSNNLSLSNNLKKLYNLEEKNYAFKVCRIEPENNIDLILNVFSITNFKLVIVGNWNNSQYGINLRNKYSNNYNLILLDPIYEIELLDQFRNNCYVYIHGHSVGGTNPSLVEAMNLGLSIVCFDVVYNRETTENKALYFFNYDELLTIVNSFKKNDENIINIALNMKNIAIRRYTWDIICNKYKILFQNN